jgi:DNA-binding transcriptional LysR family regulator
VTWRVDHDVIGRVTRAEARYGGFGEAETVSPPMTQWYGGVVGVSTDDPGQTFVDAGAEFELRYPEATVRSTTTTRIRGDAQAYDVDIEISASEAGGETWERRWQRRIPRDLQ